ncbi:protein-tyrosine-phosphatase [Nocardia sp. SYP-A9097]|uniref:tyrosine-protein phosphatase n=1 Tax=Nocardia sp. SYP-A9097 TaxID=2663237 RepID=UPI00129A4079|nr:tyrosine-protein phosphatase [Nocardia sp. SYP-A9097]MRH93092.1 protein-tyrosine-phosphatase [Nocardia sp. SYP-A9097]
MTRHIEFERLHNFRDMGGYPAADGRAVGWGRLYRADSLGKLRGRDWDRFQELGIRTVIDLRYPWEIERNGAVPERERFAYANFSIEHVPYDQAAIDPELDPWRYLADKFGELTTDGVEEIRGTIELVADEDGPTVFHCTSGKDRTGLIAALILTALEVSEEHILADFALTELATARFVADWHASNPNRELRWPGYGRAPAEVMRLVIDDLTTAHGSVHRYITEQVGVEQRTIERLQDRLLIDAS